MLHKQPSRGVLQKKCFKNIQQIYRRTPCRCTISIKLQSTFTEISLCRGCCCIFSKLLFIRTPLEGYFKCFFAPMLNSWRKFVLSGLKWFVNSLYLVASSMVVSTKCPIHVKIKTAYQNSRPPFFFTWNKY